MNPQTVYSILNEMVRRNAVIEKRSFRERFVEGVATFDGVPRRTIVHYEVNEYGVHCQLLEFQIGSNFERVNIEHVYIQADSPIGELMIRG